MLYNNNTVTTYIEYKGESLWLSLGRHSWDDDEYSGGYQVIFLTELWEYMEDNDKLYSANTWKSSMTPGITIIGGKGYAGMHVEPYNYRDTQYACLRIYHKALRSDYAGILCDKYINRIDVYRDALYNAEQIASCC